MKYLLYIAILFALVILMLNIFMTNLLLGLNNLFLVAAVIAVIAAYVYDRRSKKRKDNQN